MKAGRFSRFFRLILWAVVSLCLQQGTAFALFGFGSSEEGKSGLDFARGYDINTVTTVTGRVVSLPQPQEHAPTIIEISSGNDKLYVYVGPAAFWEKNGIPLHVNDELLVKGSKAQGRDGKVYVLTQKLTNRTTGTKLELRSEKGEPAWSGRGERSMHHEHNSGGMHHQGHDMMRGGGGMMRH
jgi:hypothetical protein